MLNKLITFLNKSISLAELEIEVAIEETLELLKKKNPKLYIKNIRLIKENDDKGSFYKVKIITKLNNK